MPTAPPTKTRPSTPPPPPDKDKGSWVVTAVLLCVTALVLVPISVMVYQQNQPATYIIPAAAPTAIPPTATASPTPPPLVVHITGHVALPDTIASLPAGSRVADALAAAGGALPDADLSRLNLAARVQDGDQIVLLPYGVTPPPLPTNAVLNNNNVSLGPQRVNVNNASAVELEALPGIGPAIAARIIAHRETHGPFANLQSLDEVRGIGPALLENLRDLISF